MKVKSKESSFMAYAHTYVWRCSFRMLLVQVASDGNDALKMLRNHPHLNARTTLLIIDVDTHDRKINDQQHCAQLLQKIKRQLKNRTLHDVIPIGKHLLGAINDRTYTPTMPFVIVCSCRDAPDFMIECIDNGAADFIVKPIRQEVVKSLFLVRGGKIRKSITRHGADCMVFRMHTGTRLISQHQWHDTFTTTNVLRYRRQTHLQPMDTLMAKSGLIFKIGLRASFSMKAGKFIKW